MTIPGFGGTLLRPDENGYDAARAVWNAMHDRRPALIARPRTPQEVAAAIAYARAQNLLIAVRAGGHSMPGHSTCDDGLVIDLRALSHVTVDPHARKAIVGGGALLGDLDRATQRHGLVVPAGVVSHTGVAGLTLGGGVGRLMRRFGLTIDSLLSAEVVTADGRILRTSPHQYPGLFWALRGGGGNFGVVTEFEFALHELSELLILATFHPLADARKVIERGRQEMADPAAPRELLWTSFLRRANDVPWMPPGLAGRHGIMSLVEWSGDPEAGRARLTRIRDDLADDEREIGWARATYAAIRPHLSEGSYVNFMGDDEDDTAAAAYGRTIERLQQVKARYDPDNIFRLNQNITPAASGPEPATMP